MTSREFLTAISSAESLTDDLRKFAADAIIKMDERNAKRNAKPSKTAVENAPIKENLLTLLTDEPQTTTDLAARAGISTQKASALLVQLLHEGKCAQTEVKVPKKGKQKAYTLLAE